MPASPFEATVRLVDDAIVVDLRGDVNGGAKAGLEQAYAQAVAAGARRLLLSFSAVDFINSTGIALLVSLLAKARADRIAVSACGLAPHYEEIFTITRLSDFMAIVPDEATALGATPA